MARITKASLAILATTVAAMSNDAAPFAFVTPADATQLLKEKLVEQNADLKDGDKLATRATEAGLKLHSEQGTTAAATPAAPSIPVVRAGTEGAVSLDLDAFVKRARSASNYDFDGMNKGDYFFIDATEARPNPAKSIASTVSAANKKFADKPEGEQRTYVVAPFTAGEAKGGYTAVNAGALVVRTK